MYIKENATKLLAKRFHEKILTTCRVTHKAVEHPAECTVQARGSKKEAVKAVLTDLSRSCYYIMVSGLKGILSTVIRNTL